MYSCSDKFAGYLGCYIHTDIIESGLLNIARVSLQASAPPVATKEAVKEIKAVLAHVSEEQIERTLLQHGNDKVAALKALLGANNMVRD